MSAAVLEINNARRSFADRPALHDVSLQVQAGEIVALLGPNGAGKTTLMRAVAGRLRLDTGSVRVMGEDPLKAATARSALGIVPQTIALYPQLTARQNLDVLARLCGLQGKQVQVAVDTALLNAALQDRADEQLSALSGGMQRRLNIVAGSLHQPQLLLLDEPTVGVDLQARELIHALLRKLCAAGIGILFSTHDFDQAAVVADRAVFMSQGKVLLEGPVAELIQQSFGDAKEVVVELARPASAETSLLLKNTALIAAEDELIWSGPLTGGYAEIASLEAQLQAAGAHVTEIRVREPGLGGVFRQVMMREQANIRQQDSAL
jgi:ABC-2 type transport system ATP-binding protein